jgi:hypothetical protein
MDTTILEEFIEELKKIEDKNKKSVSVPNLSDSQIFVINEIIKLAEIKVNENKVTNKNKYNE